MFESMCHVALGHFVSGSGGARPCGNPLVRRQFSVLIGLLNGWQCMMIDARPPHRYSCQMFARTEKSRKVGMGPPSQL